MKKPRAIIKVQGFSMIPTLKNNDRIIIDHRDTYESGDILVFKYGSKTVVHRLLKKKGKRFVCKGDNSFRVEEILSHQILGKVILIIRNKRIFQPHKVSKHFIDLSLKLNDIFMNCGLNIEDTLRSDIYKEFICVRRQI